MNPRALAAVTLALWLGAASFGRGEPAESLESAESQYRAALQLQVEEPYAKQLAELDAKYGSALEKALQQAQQAGQLEHALALRDEIDRVRAGRPFPETGEEGGSPAGKLRASYREQLARLQAEKRQAAGPVGKKFEEALAGLQESLTRAGNLEAAAAVMARRKEVAASLLESGPGKDTGATPGSGDRPRGVPPDASGFQGRWFKILDGRMTWESARRKCESLGGRLAVVPDHVTWAFLKNMIGNSAVWLGASDAETEGKWMWVDGTPVNFTAWLRDQPNNMRNEDYLHTWKGGWNDIDREGRNGRKPFVTGCVCEWAAK